MICSKCNNFLIPAGSFLATGVIHGANMVIHRDVIDKAGAFNPELGAGTPMRCEDVEMLGRALMHGFSGAYIPELVIYHHHRRKPGAQIEQLRSANDVARGAYYACMADQGFIKHWYEGMKLSFETGTEPEHKHKKYQVLLRELEGAQLYFKHKLSQNAENII